MKTTEAAPAANGQTGELREIELSVIMTSKTNPRTSSNPGFTPESLAELGESIKTQGISIPLLVRPIPLIIDAAIRHCGTKEKPKAVPVWHVLDHRAAELLKANKPAGQYFDLGFETEAEAEAALKRGAFELVDGERRFRAAQSVRLDKAPCFVKSLTDEQVQKVQILSFLREDISDLEAAEGYQRLIDSKSYTAETLAAELGIGRATIFERLKLVKLTKAPKAALQSGTIPAATAALIAGVPSHLQEKLTKEVLKGNYNSAPLSFRDTKEHVERYYRRNLNGACWKLDDATLDPKAGACGECPKKANGICMDPSCYESKEDLAWKQLCKTSEASGVQIVPEKEYEKARYGTYLKADESCYDLPGPAKRWSELAKKADVKPALTRGRDGKVIEIFTKAPLVAALKKAGVFAASTGNSHSRTSIQSRETKEQRAKRLKADADAARDKKVKEASGVKVIAAIVDAVEKDKEQCQSLLFLINDLSWNCNNISESLQRRGLVETGKRVGDEKILKLIEKFTPQQLLGLAVEMTATVDGYDYPTEHTMDLAKALKVDVKAIQKQVAAELDAAEEKKIGEPKKTPAPAPPPVVSKQKPAKTTKSAAKKPVTKHKK